MHKSLLHAAYSDFKFMRLAALSGGLVYLANHSSVTELWDPSHLDIYTVYRYDIPYSFPMSATYMKL